MTYAPKNLVVGEMFAAARFLSTRSGLAATTIGGGPMADKGKAFLVEIDSEGLAWVKSSASGPDGGCIEFAHAKGRVVVRCSRARMGARLAWNSSEWARFVAWAARQS
jgi:hypothetical protein